jgi:hypothetical protein
MAHYWGYPLWRDEYTEDTSLASWGLSAELVAALSAWQKTFDDAFDDEAGWPSTELLAAHYKEALRLKDCLVKELPDYRVELDYWQLFVNGKEVNLPS